MMAVRPRNLLDDTIYRRARGAIVGTLHAADELVSRLGRSEVRVLFEAATPLSLAVFRPVLEQLQRDHRFEFWFTTADRVWSFDDIFRAAGITERLVAPQAARWMKFDAYVNADFWNMTWLKRRARRIHLFHGVAGKYGLDAPVRFAPVVASFDRLLFPNRDRLERYAQAGLIDQEGPEAALIGYPKVDCLVDGSLDRRAIQQSLGLDPDVPTVLYAPTWSPHSSLNALGSAVIEALPRLGLNLIVKLHDRSYEPTERGSGGADWRTRLQRLGRDSRVHVAESPDASPYLFVADALITDHSSIGFEFMLLDRPVVVIDCPGLIEKARVSLDKVRLLRSSADVVAGADELVRAVVRALEHPSRLSERRRAVSGDLFYRPGSATSRAVRCIYDVLQLRMPIPELEARTSSG